MESNKKYGYLIQWLIGIGDLIVLNILFFIVYYGLNSIHTLAITGSLREVVLLLNFCYFFSLYSPRAMLRSFMHEQRRVSCISAKNSYYSMIIKINSTVRLIMNQTLQHSPFKTYYTIKILHFSSILYIYTKKMPIL